jgi:hypothetical protein
MLVRPHQVKKKIVCLLKRISHKLLKDAIKRKTNVTASYFLETIAVKITITIEIIFT